MLKIASRTLAAVGGEMRADDLRIGILQRIVGDAEAVEKTVSDRARKTHGEQHEVCIQFKVRVRHRHELAAFERHPIGMQLGDMAVMAGELGSGDAPLPVAALFMRMRRAELHGPERPGSGISA